MGAAIDSRCKTCYYTKIMKTQVQLDAIISHIAPRKWEFVCTFFVVFTLTYALLFALDWLPEAPATDESERGVAVAAASTTAAVTATDTSDRSLDDTSEAEDSAAKRDDLPATITIDALDRTIPVRNPTSRTIADLDEALLTGVVRHPDSATLTDDGNVFILGHSSYLPNVLNRNFQAFNGIQNLAWGDTIRLTSADTEYVYRVEKVYQAKASALTVPVVGTGSMLTLATCNSFGTTDDRYIVEAKLIETNRLTQAL